MTTDELDAIQARADAATGGEWTVTVAEGCGTHYVGAGEDEPWAADALLPPPSLPPYPRPMQWVRVDSSWISAVRLTPSGLEVRTSSHRTYLYLGVGERLYGELLKADSTGKFLNARVKGRYPVSETY